MRLVVPGIRYLDTLGGSAVEWMMLVRVMLQTTYEVSLVHLFHCNKILSLSSVRWSTHRLCQPESNPKCKPRPS